MTDSTASRDAQLWYTLREELATAERICEENATLIRTKKENLEVVVKRLRETVGTAKPQRLVQLDAATAVLISVARGVEVVEVERS